MQRRDRNAKIVATLGPATSNKIAIKHLFLAGVDVFRFNCSHGSKEVHEQNYRFVREVEHEVGRPIGILFDLQGPKLRVGTFKEGFADLHGGSQFRFDLSDEPGDDNRVGLPHPEIFQAMEEGLILLLDDGRLKVRVESYGKDFADVRVLTGGKLSNNKGVNVPGTVLPLSAMTKKDRNDLQFGLGLGVDWVALSFVQRVEDITELRALVGDQARIMAKLEKPLAIDDLDGIAEASDGIMVARGDLGVELAPEQVPAVQKRILRTCRKHGKPVIVATQMLESMIHAPVPTRAEVADVAGAIYDGADAVMLSGETAVGEFPEEAVSIMNRIIRDVEADPEYRVIVDAAHPAAEPTTADAICSAMRRVAELLSVSATVTYTSSGFSTLRAAKERPSAPILSLSPDVNVMRYLTLVWGVHAVQVDAVLTSDELVPIASLHAKESGFIEDDSAIVIIAGMPFGQSGTTNLIRIAWPGREGYV